MFLKSTKSESLRTGFRNYLFIFFKSSLPGNTDVHWSLRTNALKLTTMFVILGVCVPTMLFASVKNSNLFQPRGLYWLPCLASQRYSYCTRVQMLSLELCFSWALGPVFLKVISYVGSFFMYKEGNCQLWTSRVVMDHFFFPDGFRVWGGLLSLASPGSVAIPVLMVNGPTDEVFWVIRFGSLLHMEPVNGIHTTWTASPKVIFSKGEMKK